MTDWPVKTIGEVCELVNGATPDTKVKEYWGGKHAWITPAEMGGLDSPFISMSRRTLSDKGLASCSATMVPPKTVILSSRAPIGHLVINEVPMATNQGCKSLIPKDGLDFSFLYYYLKANVEVLESLGTGTTFKELSGTQLKTVEIPMPPLEEQKRIVALLDAANERVTELTACYEQARTHANNLFTSALRDALESNPDWPIRSLGEVCDFVRGVTYDKADARSEMKSGFIPLLRATNITEKGLLRDDFVFVPKNGVRADQKLISGDALITIASGSASVVGRSVLVEDPGEMTFGAFCGVLRPRPEILPRYLSHFMSSRSVRAAWSEAAQGTNINNLKRDDILQTECLLPPLEEQKRIVARLDSMKAKTSEMVTAKDAKLTAAKNLLQSILEAAFAGGL